MSKGKNSWSFIKEFLKAYWGAILIVIIAPVLINYLILKPAFFNFVGKDTDWLGFWGTYIGAVLSSVIAFYVLYKQLEQNHNENENNRQLQISVLEYQQKMYWLNMLKLKIIEYFDAFNWNEWGFIREDIILQKDREDIRKRLRLLVDKVNILDLEVRLLVSQCSDDKEKCFIEDLEFYSGEFWALFNDVDWYVFQKFPYITNNDGVKEITALKVTDNYKCRSIRMRQIIELYQYDIVGHNKEIISYRINQALNVFSYEKMRTTILNFIDYEQNKINYIIKNNHATKQTK